MEKPVPSARSRALELLLALETSGQTIAGCLRQAAATATESPADAALLSELVYGVVRHRLYLRDVLSRKLAKPLRKLPPELVVILEIALYQLLFLEKIPSYAIIWEAVEAVKRRFGPAMARLGNGVLRTIDREKADWQWQPLPPETADLSALAVRYSCPEWLLLRWRARFSLADLRELLTAFNRRPQQVVRVNPRRGSVAALEDRLVQAGTQVHTLPHLPQALVIDAPKIDRRHPSYHAGEISFQSLASQLVVATLAAHLNPGERFLDACAGAGGKLLAVAEQFGETATYGAYDPKPAALDDLTREAARLGLPEITIFRGLESLEATGATWNLVLVDAPCSGLGTLQKHPELKWRRAAADLPRFGERQRDILARYAQAVAPGGTLVYSVCSFEWEETDAVIAAFLKAAPDFALMDLATLPALAAYGTPTPHGVMLYPHRTSSEGFFLAGLRRREA